MKHIKQLIPCLSIIIISLVHFTAQAEETEGSFSEARRFVYLSIFSELSQYEYSDAEIDAVLTLDAETGKPASFIHGCPICESVFDAFTTYKASPNRYNKSIKAYPDKQTTARPNLETQANLLLRTRAIAAFVQEALLKSMEQYRWNDESDRQAMITQLQQAAAYGQTQLIAQQAKGITSYMKMWSCKMCDTINDIDKVSD